jgi:homogentisate phytyltransferase/homogentisate geranylgeranyltransferase
VWIITVFSVGIAWFKDLPDEKGDREYNLKTLAVTSGRRLAFRNGVILVVMAFALSIGMAFIFFESTARTIALISFFGFLLVFAAIASKVNVHDQESLKQFYRSYWILFFAVYLIYPLIIWF